MEGKSSLEQGLEAFRAGRIAEAIELLEEATREEPRSFRAFNYLGAAYAAIDRYNAAIGAFKAAEQINPKAASIHYNIGQAYEAAGIPDEAIYEYEAALRLDPAYARASQALEALRSRLKRPG